MTDAQFLSNNSVICDANHVKFETHMQGNEAQKSSMNCRNRSKGSPLRGTIYQKWIFSTFGGSFPTPCTDWREILYDHVPIGLAKFYVNRCN